MSKFIIYSDFDNTITKYDILDKIIEEKFSYEKDKEVENLLLINEMKYENYLLDFFEGIEYDLHNLSQSVIDTEFHSFYKWTKQHNIDFYVVSSGFKTVIKHLLPYLEDNIIFGNDVDIINNKWKVKMYDEVNNCSINKNSIIKSLIKPEHKTIFIGDGLTDFAVVDNVDYLFCKKDSLLHAKCIKQNHKHFVFNDFCDIIREITFLIR
jgi:2,3-diketo-5-methylthio-1-phosphopentane phosphatase